MSTEENYSPYKNYSSLDAIEIERVYRISRTILQKDTAGILKDMLPSDFSGAILDGLCKHCEFVHAGLLVFTTSLAEVQDLIGKMGFSVERIFPSVIVRKRVSERYGLNEESLDIRIVKGILRGNDSIEKYIELFVFPQDTPGITENMIYNERINELETHFAFQPIDPDFVILQGILSTLKMYGGFSDDGGGKNIFEGKAVALGREKQIIYLSRVVQEVDGSSKQVRLEINCPSSFVL
jgi:hypothetical protein